MGKFLAASNFTIIASSSRYPTSAQDSLLGRNKTWCAEFDDVMQYLEIDLKQSSQVTEILMQGAVNEEAWVENFTMCYGFSGEVWTNYKEGSVIKVKFKSSSVSCTLYRLKNMML